MNKKLIAAAFGLASLVSGCVSNYRANDSNEEYRARNNDRWRYDFQQFNKCDPTIIPRYCPHKH